MTFEGNMVFKFLLLCPNKVNIAFYITFFATTSQMIQLIGEKRERNNRTRERKNESERTGERKKKKEKRERE